MARKFIGCRSRVLTEAQLEVARRRALEINPDNALERREVYRTPAGRRGGPKRLAVLVGHKWPSSGVRLTVQFLDSWPADLRKRVLSHMNAWNQTANVFFTETHDIGEVRIARLDSPEDVAGYWSYVGDEILSIDEDEPTMNLEGFTMKISDAEFRRVVRHEAGHTLGFDHEHMRKDLVNKIDRKKAIAFFDRDQGWTAAETIEQVLTPLDEKSIMGTTEADPDSIMCYQLPGKITKNGKPIRGGKDINEKDFAFAAKIYPKLAKASGGAPPPPAAVAPAGPLPPIQFHSPAADADAFHLVVMDDIDTVAGSDDGKDGKPRFARLFASFGGARVTEPMRLRMAKGEKPTHFGEIIAVQKRLKDYTNREKGSLPSDEDLVAFGGKLFETLFQGDVHELYIEARARQNSGKLDFVFTSMIPWIAELPWEFTYDPTRKTFLATEEAHLIRNVLTAVPADVIAPRSGPLRILVASAQPVGFGRLSIEQETRVIRRGFEPLVAAGLVEIEILPRVTPEALHERVLTGDFQVVHFIGHGGFDEDSEEGYLIFESHRGAEIRVSERSAREMLCGRGVQLVFLNACQTGTGGLVEFNKGVAQSLVARGLPALVANQYSVLDSSATSFAQRFYWSLAQGLTLGQSAREARIAVNYTLQGDAIDWAVPVVYARDPGMTLAKRPAKFVPFPESVRRAERQRTASGRAKRVAMWDIDGVFPMLEETLEAMNGAQQSFSFELVAMSPPLDVWYLEKRAPDDGPYLWAERLAERMAGKPAELAVDLLVCISRHWLCDDDAYNIYGWWPDERSPAVLVFSWAGFEDMPAAGRETDRAIANLTVGGLAGFLTDADVHEKGNRACPLYYNGERNPNLMTCHQAFDKSCLAKLRRKLSKEQLPALVALLNAFP